MEPVDLIAVILFGLIPLLLIMMAVFDWRRTARKRYLLLTGLYLFLGVSLVSSFLVTNEISTLICSSSLLFLLGLAILQRSFRRSDAGQVVQQSAE